MSEGEGITLSFPYCKAVHEKDKDDVPCGSDCVIRAGHHGAAPGTHYCGKGHVFSVKMKDDTKENNVQEKKEEVEKKSKDKKKLTLKDIIKIPTLESPDLPRCDALPEYNSETNGKCIRAKGHEKSHCCQNGFVFWVSKGEAIQISQYRRLNAFSSDDDYTCDMCDNVERTRYLAERHEAEKLGHKMSIPSKVGDVQGKCKICHLTLYGNKTISNHMDMNPTHRVTLVAENDRVSIVTGNEFQCAVRGCDTFTPSMDEMMEHLVVMHMRVIERSVDQYEDWVMTVIKAAGDPLPLDRTSEIPSGV